MALLGHYSSKRLEKLSNRAFVSLEGCNSAEIFPISRNAAKERQSICIPPRTSLPRLVTRALHFAIALPQLSLHSPVMSSVSLGSLRSAVRSKAFNVIQCHTSEGWHGPGACCIDEVFACTSSPSVFMPFSWVNHFLCQAGHLFLFHSKNNAFCSVSRLLAF